MNSTIQPDINRAETLFVKHVDFNSPLPTIEEIAVAIADAPEYKIDKINWPERNGGYAPDVRFKIIYSDSNIYIKYSVTEEALRATYEQDKDSNPWKDDCVEFFFAPYNDKNIYFNLEMNCIGHGILGRKNTDTGENYHYSPNELKEIRRFPTLGDKAFGVIESASKENFHWEIVIEVPLRLYYPDKEEIVSLAGKTLRGNFYKCGDDMPTPHYLSWSPINTVKPNFHTPECFGFIRFE